MIRTKLYSCDESHGRDAGKSFLLTEMDADRAEKWAMRALNALAASGLQIPDGAGLAEIASVGLDSFRGLPWNETEPLLDEMFSCVQCVPDPNKRTAQYPLGYPRPLAKGDIEEVKTRLKLRLEVLELHLGFSLADKLLTSRASAVGGPPTNTETSPES